MVFQLCIPCSLVISFVIVGNLKCSELFIRLNNVVTLEDLLELFLPFIYKIKTRFLEILGRNMSNCSKEFHLQVQFGQKYIIGAVLAKLRLVFWTLQLNVCKNCMFVHVFIYNHVKGTFMGNGLYTKTQKNLFF